MCFPLGSTSGTVCGPTKSFVMTIGPGKRELRGGEGNICGESGSDWLLGQESCLEPQPHGGGRRPAVMELIAVFPRQGEVGWTEGSQENEASWGVGTLADAQPTLSELPGTAQLPGQEGKESGCV